MGKIKQYFSMQRVLLLALLFVCLAPLSALAQTIQLTGTVTDTKGESCSLTIIVHTMASSTLEAHIARIPMCSEHTPPIPAPIANIRIIP